METKQQGTVLNNDIREMHAHIKNGLTARGQTREGDCQDKAIINLKPDNGKHFVITDPICETGLTGIYNY
jgi:hypothetical protein